MLHEIDSFFCVVESLSLVALLLRVHSAQLVDDDHVIYWFLVQHVEDSVPIFLALV